KNNNKENFDTTANMSKKNTNNNNLKQKKTLNNLSTWNEQVTQELKREKTNLLQEIKENKLASNSLEKKAILATSLSQEMSIDKTLKDRSIKDQKEVLIANKNNNLTNKLEKQSLQLQLL
ncbi:9968_t:CDS:2, partial [Scutellospora calospora]